MLARLWVPADHAPRKLAVLESAPAQARVVRKRDHSRRILLFVVAVVLPCLLLVALSLRMIGQEQELAEKRAAEDRQRLAGDIRQ